ncbi:MAG: FAD:protein FMN transferase [Vicinamibacterales bacterium]
MFDILAYHSSRPQAERAVDEALDEVERLDRVMSHFKPESDLSTLNREGRRGFVKVDLALYDVIETSLTVSRLSGGKFDVTVAPLVRMWKDAQGEGRSPSPAEIAGAKRCVGYENVDLEPPDRIRFRSDCLEIELGGIGKGYAVDRAIAVLRSAGIQNAVVNGGSSSITGIGTPPGGIGWPVRLGANAVAREVLLLDRSISTSQQDGAIIDPQTALPAAISTMITVSAPSATLADALSTALVMMTRTEGAKLMGNFSDVSVVYDEDAR